MSRSNKGNKSNPRLSSYRLDIIDTQTLEKLRSIFISKRKIALLIMLGILIIAGLTASAIIFTPFRTYIPGYANIERNPKFISLHKNVLQLEKVAEAQNRYIQSLQRIVTGQDQSALEPTADPNQYIDENQNGSGLDYSILTDIESTPIDDQTRTKRIEELYLVAPLKGIVSASFLEEKKHLGIDIVAPENTAIKSILSGYVILSDWTLETGYSIGIQHGYGLVSFYKHNSALLKTTGDYIAAGEAIAVIGNTGEMTSGPHLHFELWRDGKPMNPADYITFD